MLHPIEHIKKYIPIPPEIEHRLKSLMQQHTFKRRDTINTISVLRSNTFFIVEGAARVFFVQGGKDHTTSFAFADQFVTLSHHLLNNPYSNVTIEFLAPTTVIFIPRPSANQPRPMLDPETEAEVRTFIITALIDNCRQLEERVEIMQSTSATERYNWLISRYPQVLEYATITQIASFLGVAKETLYRIRAGHYRRQ